jgi:hypothetical protein
MNLSDIDAIEQQGIEKLQSSIGRLRLGKLKFENFAEILLQRYWISQEFTHIYDAGQDRLTSRAYEVRPTIRRIIREEYPNDRGAWKTPSHREDLVTDLLNLGVTWEMFIASRRSKVTASILSSAKNIIYNSAQRNHSDIRLLVFLRYWGEILTAVEYEELYPKIVELLGVKPSVFYDYHKAHDAKKFSLSELINSTHALTHADKLGKQLVGLLATDSNQVSAIAAVIKVTESAIENKMAFYSQF